ncbi:MAG: single-stranded DNA-binding protein [Mycolicibacterium sp.]|uniref:single-stranded DNA-binding protein n=1 Tax=Mycolicibacterium sp. TaxID=2320850 RepID=UPI003D0B11CB
MSTNTIVIAGNITADPTIRDGGNGRFVANFTVADTPRHKDQNSGEWIDGEPLFQKVAVWGPAAENVADSLKRGTRVVVTGRLAQRNFQAEGETKTYTEIQADEVAVSLKFATAAVTKNSRNAAAN